MFADLMIALFDLFTPFAVQIGLSCATLQIVLYFLFSTKAFGNGPWAETPSFTAHQVVVLPVLIYLSIQGLREIEFGGGAAAGTAVDRLTGRMHDHFSEFVLGMMFFWDIPTGLCTPALRELPMVLHHIGMFATAAIAMGILSDGTPVLGYYAPFYFGLIELSSLPLIVVDIFHPKHKVWNKYLTSEERPPWILKLNEISRLAFAFLFLLLRTIAFPYVSVVGVFADVIEVASLPLAQRNNVPNLPLFVMAFLNVLFSCLQLYWGSLLIRQVFKLIRGTGDSTKVKVK
jgi:TLC domain